MTTSHAPLIADLHAATTRLLDSLLTAASVQWDPPLIPRPVDDTTERASGTISNPTLDTATHPVRLRVRAEVISAEAEIAAFTRAANARADALDAAVETWES